MAWSGRWPAPKGLLTLYVQLHYQRPPLPMLLWLTTVPFIRGSRSASFLSVSWSTLLWGISGTQ